MMCEPPFVDSCCSMLSCGGGGSRISTAFAPTALGALSAELFTEPRSPSAAAATGSCVLRRLRALLSQLSPPAPATETPPLGVTMCPRHVTAGCDVAAGRGRDAIHVWCWALRLSPCCVRCACIHVNSSARASNATILSNCTISNNGNTPKLRWGRWWR